MKKCYLIFIKSKSANNAVKYGFDISSGNLNFIHQNSLDVEGFNLASSDDYSLKEKLESVGTELSKWKNIKINYRIYYKRAIIKWLFFYK